MDAGLLIKYLPAFSESFIFYLFRSPQYRRGSLQPAADKGSSYIMHHAILAAFAFECTFATQQHRRCL